MTADLLQLGFANAVLPIAVLALLVVALPAAAERTLSQRHLALVMVVTGLVVWAVGAGLMAWAYAAVNAGAWPGFGYALQRSGQLGLMWGPVLALVWLMRAQGVERRRGLLMGRGNVQMKVVKSRCLEGKR